MKNLNNNKKNSVTDRIKNKLIKYNEEIRNKDKSEAEKVYKEFEEAIENTLKEVNTDINIYIDNFYNNNINFKKYLSPVRKNHTYVNNYFPNITNIVYKGTILISNSDIKHRVILENTYNNKDKTLEEFIQTITNEIINEYTY